MSNQPRPLRPLGLALALALPPLLTACGGTAVSLTSAESSAPSVQALAAPVAEQTYTLANLCSGKPLGVQGGSTANGAAIVQQAATGAGSQQWTLRATDGGYFRVVARHSGKGLDVSNAATSAGSPVAQWDLWGGTNQQWKFEDVGSGTYELSPRHAPGMRLDVRGASSADGAAVQLYGDNNTCAQRWRLSAAQASSTPTPGPAPTPTPTVAPVTARRVMPLGDSITDGYNIPGGYRTPLLPGLTAAGLPTDFVGSAQNGPSALADRDHEGHSGWRIDEIAGQVDGWLDRAQPDVILLMIGTNDMIQNRDVGGAPTRLGALLDRIAARRPSATVIVASLPPLSDRAQDARARTFNAALPGLVSTRAAQGRRVKFVDASARLTLADLADGVHPNAAGYAKLAELWLGALRGL